MDTNEKVESVSDAAIIRAVLPKHGPKRLARLMGVPLGTAHDWFYRRLSSSRRRDLAIALLAELDRQDAERVKVRQNLTEIAGETSVATKVDRVLAGSGDSAARTVVETPIARQLARWAAK